MIQQTQYIEPSSPKRMFTGLALVMAGMVVVGLSLFTTFLK